MMGTITPKEEIQKLIDAEGALQLRLLEFEKEEKVRLMALDAGKESLQRDLRAVDKDLSPGEVVAASKEVQAKYRIMGDDLQAAGESLAAAVEDITKDLRSLQAERGALQKIEHERAIDIHCQKVWHSFEKFVQFYEVTRDFFYETLLPIIDDGYNLNPKFHNRGHQLGLNTDIFLAIDSLRPGSLRYPDGSPRLNLGQTLLAFQNMKLESILKAEPYPSQDDNSASLWPDGENPQFSNQ